MSRKIRLSLCGILLFLTPLVACTSSPNQSLSKIRLVEVTHSLFYAPQYVALTKGFFQAEGLEIELINGNGGDKTMTTLLAGQSDIILMGTEGAIYVTARGATEPVMAFAQLTQTDGTFLLSRKPISSFTWDQLEGRTLLGQRRGGMPEMVAEYVLRKHGLNPGKNLTVIQNIEFQNLGTAYASGTGEFAQLFEPVASKLEQEGKGKIVASFGTESGTLPYTVYLAKKSFIKQNPDTIKRFTRALYRAQQWIEKQPTAEIVKVLQSHFPELDSDLLSRVIDRYRTQKAWASDPLIDRKEYQHFLTIMKQAGELPKEVPYEQIIHTQISEEIIKEQ